MARSARPRFPRIRALLEPAVDNWLSRGYLAVVGASLAFFLWAVYVAPDPGFAGIWPVMATAPFGVVTFLLPLPEYGSSFYWVNPLVLSAVTVVSGLVNASLLGLVARRIGFRAVRPAA
ncbi:SCO4225 family membrane protein [Streptomyces sp. NPDC058953]|uniref:SCO4225 family membrane protein n=1 Tax=unclassified Streptomyces TaxID=2593676 RepID=UPI0036AFD727